MTVNHTYMTPLCMANRL